MSEPQPKATKYKPRLLIELTPEQRQVITQYLEYGMQKQFFSTIMQDLTGLLQEFGDLFVIFVMERRFSYRQHMVEYANQRFANIDPGPAEPTGATTADPGRAEPA